MFGRSIEAASAHARLAVTLALTPGVSAQLLVRVGRQWELRPVLALGDQRFVFALPLGARTSAHSSALH